jgi:hypothetical protein
MDLQSCSNYMRDRRLAPDVVDVIIINAVFISNSQASQGL